MGINSAFQWRCQPVAAQLVGRWVHELVDEIPFLDALSRRMRNETGTRLIDWIDHLTLPPSAERIGQLNEAAFVMKTQDIGSTSDEPQAWQHPGGLFPTILLADRAKPSLWIKVESVSDFLNAHSLTTEVQGQPGSPLRTAVVAITASAEVGVIERHGATSTIPRDVSPERIASASQHAEAFRTRQRTFDREAEGFEHAAALFDRAAEEIGQDWACDLFFAAERAYWQSRNRAARIQKARQDRLGLGWANHDHHTYRSSREHFVRLISLLERMGFQARERFYGGAEAGWGAQVMQQPNVGVVVFADVDLSPQEVTGDFAHEGLSPRKELGTVGLWCALHGEAMLQAGMHHLECQFEFDSARDQLAAEGIATMPPFTDFAFLKQAFTQGEVWEVNSQRLEAVQRRGALSADQADRIREHGVIGSHLEILQRDEGYKGFNQTGISEIIRETDPRRSSAFRSR